MSRVNTYLNFERNTEEAFKFYKSVFGGEFEGPIRRIGEVASSPDRPPLSDADKGLVMHVSLPILGGHLLMGTDAPESMGFTLTRGNSMHISLEPDTREEADQLYADLSAGGEIGMVLTDMSWGAYYGDFTDKFGVSWMINVPNAA